MTRLARWSLTPLLASGCFFNPTSAMTGTSAEATTTMNSSSGSTGGASAADTALPTTGEPTAGASCGDFVVDESEDEECDNGANNNGDGAACKADCTLNVCGDAYVAPAIEGCDDGNTDNGDGCSATCTLEGCGDGNKVGAEECDDGNKVDEDGCTNLCRLPVCGDAIKNGNEQCDDGNSVDEDDCTNACKDPVCGDGILGAGEACDDGNAIDDDECSNACATASCGDGVVQANEECDDANQDSTDACLNSCKNAICGDSIVQAGIEECDDGNDEDADACLDCKAAVCGDGVVFVGHEECDDGNILDNDVCGSTCLTAGYWVFVTSKQYQYAGDIKSVADADLECTQLAADKPIAGKYKAWLSATNAAAKDRLDKSTHAYIMRDGTKIAANWVDLTNGNLLAKFNRTEENLVIEVEAVPCLDAGAAMAHVWTGTDPLGNLVAEGTCNDWTSKSFAVKGRVGLLNAVEQEWTDGCQVGCNTAARLYCIEQP